MPASVATALHQAVADARFFDRPAATPSEAVGADLLVYEITIDDGGRRHSVSFVEDGTEAVAPLRDLKARLIRASP